MGQIPVTRKIFWHRTGVAILGLLILLFALIWPLPAKGADAQFQRAKTLLQDRLDRDAIPLSLPARGKVIVVNVPAFELLAIEDGREVFRSRIIVGHPATPTPLIDTHVASVRFRPTWRPTRSMVASGEYPDRVWPPGDRNPLGLVAIRLTPPLLVYLHDTNHREKFAEPDRALSHGCVRVERWDALAAWVLGLDLSKVHRRAHGARTRTDPAPPVPVFFRYYTRFPDAKGRLRTHPDIYGLKFGQAPSRPTACGPA